MSGFYKETHMPPHGQKRPPFRLKIDKSTKPSSPKEQKTCLALYRDLSKKPEGKIKAYGILYPLNREPRNPLFLSTPPKESLTSGDIVRITYTPPPRAANRVCQANATVIEKLGSESDPHFFSLLAALSAQIPSAFSAKTLQEASGMTLPSLKGYEDLTALPFVTIDDETARDFDDAVWASHDTTPANIGGYVLKVAIADVSYFVRPGTALDADAYLRGNSTYFPTHMLPMLPEILSTDLCSLKPHVNRPTLVATLTIDKEGILKAWRFDRAMIQSHGRLTYKQVQSYYNAYITPKKPSDPKDPTPDISSLPQVVQNLIPVLYDTYKTLRAQRSARGTLDFELPDPRLTVDPETQAVSVSLSEPLDSHKLIEEFMVTANRAAALCLENSPLETLFRIHPEPSEEKQTELRRLLESLGLEGYLTKKITPKVFSEILDKTSNLPTKEFIHMLLLRMQSQALYHPDNQGHFGLNLSHYAHFTSPIRRYADLLVHRGLISHLGLGPGNWKKEPSEKDYETFGAHLSQTEKRSTQAEREAFQRYVISSLQDRKGEKLKGTINGVHKSGLFITAQDTYADGFLPLRYLPKDVYYLSEETHTLKGRHHTFHLGDMVDVKLEEANPYSRSLIFSMGEKSKEKRKKKASSKKKYKAKKA